MKWIQAPLAVASLDEQHAAFSLLKAARKILFHSQPPVKLIHRFSNGLKVEKTFLKINFLKQKFLFNLTFV